MTESIIKFPLSLCVGRRIKLPEELIDCLTDEVYIIPNMVNNIELIFNQDLETITAYLKEKLDDKFILALCKINLGYIKIPEILLETILKKDEKELTLIKTGEKYLLYERKFTEQF